MNQFTLTTSIAYPNAKPHIGYALELVQADFMARYHRLQGDSVYFLTGVDEHGLKIQRAADKEQVSPQEYVDAQANNFQVLLNALGTSQDRFIRTTEPDHKLMAQALWKMCLANGDIYQKQYRAWYDVKEEEFLGLVDEHPDPSVFATKPEFIEQIDELNYFFRLSKYSETLSGLLRSGELKVSPASRCEELLNFIGDGLQDVSISREKRRLSWGVEVPGDEESVMYVWFDALSNYLTATCTIDDRGIIIPTEKWPAALHIVGKDIQRFHAILWPAMLLSADLPLPREVLAHGFIAVHGQKISKSLGNAVDPLPLIEHYGADALRWYVLAEISTTQDGDYTEEHFAEVYRADLMNDLGNLVSRVWSMAQKYCEGKVPQVPLELVQNVEEAIVAETWGNYYDSIDHRDIKAALDAVSNLLSFCNRRIEEQKPWAMAKDPFKAEELDIFLYELLETIRQIALMLLPVLPTTAARIFTEVLAIPLPESFSESTWGGLTPGALLGTEQTILFPRLDD